jgi:hypothetical protein
VNGVFLYAKDQPLFFFIFIGHCPLLRDCRAFSEQRQRRNQLSLFGQTNKAAPSPPGFAAAFVQLLLHIGVLGPGDDIVLQVR